MDSGLCSVASYLLSCPMQMVQIDWLRFSYSSSSSPITVGTVLLKSCTSCACMSAQCQHYAVRYVYVRMQFQKAWPCIGTGLKNFFRAFNQPGGWIAKQRLQRYVRDIEVHPKMCLLCMCVTSIPCKICFLFVCLILNASFAACCNDTLSINC